METRVSELVGAGSSYRGSSAHGSGLNNSAALTAKKILSKNGKKAKFRSARFSKPSNNPPYLPPEVEEGNIEYKLKLVNPTQYRFEHLATQMKWRLQEGRGEAVYQIGVEDNGLLVGLSEADLRASLRTLHRMAEKVGADITVLREREVDYDSEEPLKIAEVLVRKVPDDQQFLDLRVAVLGNVDSGKSTLLGVLTQGELDNGRGRARLNLFRHLHEIQTGRTSSISFEILGFNSKGEVVNYSESRTAEEICESASKMITFIDLAGHHKYLKTTIFGLTSYCPDFAMLVVSANTGIVGTTREHLGLAMALKVPIFIVDEIYTVPDVGTVVGGTLYSGICQEGEQLIVGPMDNGQFRELTVCSIQRNRSACRVLRAGQAATLALGEFDRSLLRKGMVMVSPEMEPTICWMFEAEIVLLFHAKTFHKGFQVTVHVGNVRQTATVEALQGKEELRTGEKAVVIFKFIKHPEYLKVGAKLLFRHGVTKGIGQVTKLQPLSQYKHKA
ncbi:GTP-binding protein 2 isoform X2 [Trichomycterus rosablanca]|uniref:GTP-binding protein 2 isoform X2 n=1 Tax=Trichomycterus rosablanca TaxID=2290929 RepID=UPI002F35AC8D